MLIHVLDMLDELFDIRLCVDDDFIIRVGHGLLVRHLFGIFVDLLLGNLVLDQLCPEGEGVDKLIFDLLGRHLGNAAAGQSCQIVVDHLGIHGADVKLTVVLTVLPDVFVGRALCQSGKAFYLGEKSGVGIHHRERLRVSGGGDQRLKIVGEIGAFG